MRVYLFVSLLVISIGSLSGQNQGKVKIDSGLKTVGVDSTDWTYPDYVIKHEDGKWENTIAFVGVE